jgi:signal transduction histidine kinase/ligand-binding sensor domain-containing protein
MVPMKKCNFIYLQTAFCLLLRLFSYQSVSAQTFHNLPQERGEIEFTRIGIEQGLSLGSVNCIMQDRYGFLWVGTQDGLNRYDGYNFTVYRRERADSTSLQDTWISSVIEDHEGTLWVAGGYNLHRYNRATNTFQKMPFISVFGVNSGQAIRRIYEDSKGFIWICTREGLVRFNPKNNHSERFTVPLPPVLPYTTERPSDVSVFVEDVIENDDGTFYLACGPDGLYHFAPSATNPAERFQYVHILPSIPSQEVVTRLTRDASGMVWIGTVNGLVRWNATTRTAEDVYLFDGTLQQRRALQKQDYFYIYQASSSAINDILHGRNGTVWIATANGLYTLDGSRKHLTHIQNNPFNATSLTGNLPYALCEDASGVLWIGDFSYGLSKYPQLQQRFRTYRNNPIDVTSLSNNYIRGIIEDSQRNIWVCTQYGGLNMLNRTTGKWTHYQHDPKNPRTLPSNNVWAVAEDRTGELWVGMYANGLQKFSPKTQTFTPFRDTLFHEENIICLYRDKHDNIWAGGGGVHKISPNGRVLKKYPFPRPFPTQAICQDHLDITWVGRDDGLWKIMTNDSIIHVPLPEQGVVVTMINEDTKGNLWVMSKGHGIFLFNANRTTLQRITTSEGLPHQNVYAALEDERGDMWISSDNGVARYSPSTKIFRVYTVGDGLQAQEFNRRAFGTTARGEMMFGGINGVNIFQPTSLRDNTTPPPVVLTALQARGRTIASASSLLGIQEIHLPYTDNFLRIEFAALEYSNPTLNQYSYKLDGLDEDWINVGAKHDATYTNLAPNTYTFRVRAANADGYWNNEGRTLRIIISPPWWQTVWAYIVYALLVVGSISGIILLIVRRQKRDFIRLQNKRETLLLHSKNTELLELNAQLQVLNIEKNELLGIVSHDLKNPIGGVRGLAELIRQGFMEQDQIVGVAEQIVQTSDRMFDLVRNLLDINQLESGGMQFQRIVFDVSTPLTFTVEQFRVVAEQKQLKIHNETEAAPYIVIADEQAVSQVLENLLSNAVKYSPKGKNIFVRLRNVEQKPHGKMVRIEVQDEGPGLSASDMEKLFGKFMRLSARPTAGEHSTGLGLSIVKGLVEGMNGKVWCESELGRGATFIVILPSAEE